MRTCWLPLLLFAALGLSESVGYWTLHDFSIQCDDAGVSCVCHFSVSKDEGETRRDDCLFKVDGEAGQRANETDFGNVSCLGTDQWRTNGGWSAQGFLTVVVTDTYAGEYAFFAYSDDKMSGGQVVDEQTRLAYKSGTFDVSDVVVPTVKRDVGLEWQVVNLQKDYDQVTGTTELQFAIDAGSLRPPCTVIATGADGSEVNVGSFHMVKCVESNWFVSWDYSVITDAAMLTLVEPTSMTTASFLWDNVSSSPSLGNSVRTVASPCDD
ncbi:hypothetical protein GE09DRAFT_772748 [Coniochaeta sp. 2T2.1]|nr:hypothetical protein GE09DRAFT_772748 [Coniochaeta sp. 2T2.1]